MSTSQAGSGKPRGSSPRPGTYNQRSAEKTSSAFCATRRGSDGDAQSRQHDPEQLERRAEPGLRTEPIGQPGQLPRDRRHRLHVRQSSRYVSGQSSHDWELGTNLQFGGRRRYVGAAIRATERGRRPAADLGRHLSLRRHQWRGLLGSDLARWLHDLDRSRARCCYPTHDDSLGDWRSTVPRGDHDGRRRDQPRSPVCRLQRQRHRLHGERVPRRHGGSPSHYRDRAGRALSRRHAAHPHRHPPQRHDLLRALQL